MLARKGKKGHCAEIWKELKGNIGERKEGCQGVRGEKEGR